MRVDRTTKIAFRIGALAALAALGAPARAQQQQQAPPPIKVTKVKDNIYFVQGGAGSNNGFIVGKNGVIVVDTKITPASEKDELAEIAKVTPKMVTAAIITHSDADHVNGLAALPASVTVIAQENCKAEMQASAGSRNPAPQDRLPSKTYAKTDKLTLDGVHVRLYHWAPAHTSGDTIAYFPDQKVVFGGDILTTNAPNPLIHLEKHGSAAGWIENVKGALALNADTYVTGHGDIMTKADVQKKLDFVQDKYNKIKTMAAQGKSLDDIKTSLGEPTAPPQPGANGQPPAPTFTEVIYKEVTAKT
jgi:cyclase